MNPLTWQNSGQLFVAQDVIKVNIYSVAELRNMMKKEFLLTIALVVNMATYAQTNLSLMVNGNSTMHIMSIVQIHYFKKDFINRIFKPMIFKR